MSVPMPKRKDAETVTCPACRALPGEPCTPVTHDVRYRDVLRTYVQMERQLEDLDRVVRENP